MSRMADTNARMRRRVDRDGSFAALLLTAATTAILSHRQQTLFSIQNGPHIMLTTMGQHLRKTYHQVMSALFRCTQWSRSAVVAAASIRL